MAWADEQISKLNGQPIQQVGGPNIPYIADNVDFGTLTLSVIVAEMTRLEALFSAEKLVRDQYIALTKRIAQENAFLKVLEEKLTDAKGAAARRKTLQSERDEAYKHIFEAIINEQSVLAELYAPLMDRLSATVGTLNKLGFSVRRIVDVNRWGEFAEKNLLDLRKAGPFNGRGALTKVAEEELKHVWEKGTALEIQEVISNFISTYQKDMLKHAPYAP